MATHSSILAWRIPWTEKPSRLKSIGSQRVGHDWGDLAGTQKHARAWTPAHGGSGLDIAASGYAPSSLRGPFRRQTPVYVASPEKGHLRPSRPAQPFQYKLVTLALAFALPTALALFAFLFMVPPGQNVSFAEWRPCFTTHDCSPST